MKTLIVSSLDEETIQGEGTIQGRKLYEEIRYMVLNRRVDSGRMLKLNLAMNSKNETVALKTNVIGNSSIWRSRF